jgi:hypothetical protein
MVVQNALGQRFLSISDQKTQGTDGGTFPSGGWRTRDLNTVDTNEISGASLSSNQITLPTGTYYCQWSCPASNNNANQRLTQSRLQNITDATTLLLGVQGAVTINTIIRVFGNGRFTLTNTKVLEVQHIIDLTVNTIGFGAAGNLDTEIYTTIQIWRLY